MILPEQPSDDAGDENTPLAYHSKRLGLTIIMPAELSARINMAKYGGDNLLGLSDRQLYAWSSNKPIGLEQWQGDILRTLIKIEWERGEWPEQGHGVQAPEEYLGEGEG